MWKKLQSLLFEEEDEIIEEIDDEIETEKPPVKKSVIAQMNPELSNTKEEKLVEAVKEELNETDAIEDLLIEDEVKEIVETKRFGLSADDVEVKKVKQQVNEPLKKVYEFHPVISPMFGATESKHPESEPRVIQEAHATLPRSVINTVISPIYGDLEVKKQKEVFREEKIEITPEKVKISEPIEEVVHFDAIVEETTNQRFEEFLNEEEVETKKTVYEDMNLDDLLGAHKEESVKLDQIDDEDAHQFSLFDEN